MMHDIFQHDRVSVWAVVIVINIKIGLHKSTNRKYNWKGNQTQSNPSVVVAADVVAVVVSFVVFVTSFFSPPPPPPS